MSAWDLFCHFIHMMENAKNDDERMAAIDYIQVLMANDVEYTLEQYLNFLNM